MRQTLTIASFLKLVCLRSVRNSNGCYYFFSVSSQPSLCGATFMHKLVTLLRKYFFLSLQRKQFSKDSICIKINVSAGICIDLYAYLLLCWSDMAHMDFPSDKVDFELILSQGLPYWSNHKKLICLIFPRS